MSLCAVPALAADTAAEYGDFVVETAVENGCSYADPILTITAPGAYTVSMKASRTSTKCLINVVNENNA